MNRIHWKFSASYNRFSKVVIFCAGIWQQQIEWIMLSWQLSWKLFWLLFQIFRSLIIYNQATISRVKGKIPRSAVHLTVWNNFLFNASVSLSASRIFHFKSKLVRYEPTHCQLQTSYIRTVIMIMITVKDSTVHSLIQFYHKEHLLRMISMHLSLYIGVTQIYWIQFLWSSSSFTSYFAS